MPIWCRSDIGLLSIGYQLRQSYVGSVSASEDCRCRLGNLLWSMGGGGGWHSETIGEDAGWVRSAYRACWILPASSPIYFKLWRGRLEACSKELIPITFGGGHGIDCRLTNVTTGRDSRPRGKRHHHGCHWLIGLVSVLRYDWDNKMPLDTLYSQLPNASAFPV